MQAPALNRNRHSAIKRAPSVSTGRLVVYVLPLLFSVVVWRYRSDESRKPLGATRLLAEPDASYCGGNSAHKAHRNSVTVSGRKFRRVHIRCPRSTRKPDQRLSARQSTTPRPINVRYRRYVHHLPSPQTRVALWNHLPFGTAETARWRPSTATPPTRRAAIAICVC